jgi:polyisoprenoid-binding protein YceI
VTVGFGRLVLVALLGGAALAAHAAAEPAVFKLLPNYSRATFKIDALLETVVGTATADGLQAALTVDPTRPQNAKGTVRVDMSVVRTGIDKRDADMRGKSFLDTEVEGNRWVTFELKSVDIFGPLVVGKDLPAKLTGLLTIKQKAMQRTADATITWIKLSPEQQETQKRFGFTGDNLKVRARFATTFTDHGLQIPQVLILKVSNDIYLETDLTFVRAQ